jgi:hypothetical protein
LFGVCKTEFSFSFSLQTLFRSARPNRFKTLKTTRFYQVLSTIRLLSDLWFMFLNTKVAFALRILPPSNFGSLSFLCPAWYKVHVFSWARHVASPKAP